MILGLKRGRKNPRSCGGVRRGQQASWAWPRLRDKYEGRAPNGRVLAEHGHDSVGMPPVLSTFGMRGFDLDGFSLVSFPRAVAMSPAPPTRPHIVVTFLGPDPIEIDREMRELIVSARQTYRGHVSAGWTGHTARGLDDQTHGEG